MKSAYLYVRVSTDEQKRKGYSLPEQEDRLLRYCEQNQIAVKGIFREDFSAKDFNRPEWKKIVKTLRSNRKRPPENILFIKWDRFSRSIEYAYQMLGILRGLNTKPLAIDQPIDFDVPESIVMLAIYLSIPEDENIFSARRECIDDRKVVLSEISQHNEMMSKARRYFLVGKIDFEDFRAIKEEHNEIVYNLNGRLQHLAQKLNGYDSKNGNIWSDGRINIFQSYNTQDFVGKRHIASLFTPSTINISERNFNPLQINPILKKIVTYGFTVTNRTEKPLKVMEKSINRITKSFSGRIVSINQAIRVLRNNGTRVDGEEAVTILDFLYMLANSFKKVDGVDVVLQD
ncbi:MAG: recombinase family protein [Proteiniphilum sp.]